MTEAMRICTMHGAYASFEENSKGSLVAGKLADFVVTTANPLDDITNTRTIESVWISGNRVPRDD